jgi:hypothetical protein
MFKGLTARRLYKSFGIKGLNGWIPVGGQVDPSSIVVDRLV